MIQMKAIGSADGSGTDEAQPTALSQPGGSRIAHSVFAAAGHRASRARLALLDRASGPCTPRNRRRRCPMLRYAGHQSSRIPSTAASTTQMQCPAPTAGHRNRCTVSPSHFAACGMNGEPRMLPSPCWAEPLGSTGLSLGDRLGGGSAQGWASVRKEGETEDCLSQIAGYIYIYLCISFHTCT